MLFIAEIGLNHNGNLDLSYELIKQAKYAGADIVKFQLGWRGEKDEMNYMNLETLKSLKRWCNYMDVELMTSIFTPQAYSLAKEVGFKRYKIASRTLKDNPELVKEIISEEKQTIISLGMWDEDHPPFLENDNIKYLWCKSKYPASPWDLIDFPKCFTDSHLSGYSDHSIGIEIPLLAISRGAQIIEKHFTLDKSDNTIRDHVLSATPDEFKILTQLGKNIYRNFKLGI